ncbi:MAG: Hsp20 family protein [Gammaproteobacteria bacterium]|nr:Hsp20 family protein [Gammaproteobacteria bacterium]
MDMKKLNPWNWFKHEEKQDKQEVVPVKPGETLPAQNPFANMMQLHREIDRLFDEAFRGFPSLSMPSWPRLGGEDFVPAFHASVNVASDDKQYTITLEAPGMEQKDLSIELKDQALFIKGNKQQETEEKDKHYYRIERQYGSFERVLALPDDANADEISASMKNGVLTVTIPRKELPESASGKRIEIKSK